MTRRSVAARATAEGAQKPVEASQGANRAQETASTLSEPSGAAQGAVGRLCFTLPFPPSVNHLWRRVGAKTLLSAEGRRYHETVGRHVRWQGGCPPDPPHAVSIVAVVPDKRRRDIDNILKALLDPVYRAIGMDDSVIVRLKIEKRATDELGPRVEIALERAGG